MTTFEALLAVVERSVRNGADVARKLRATREPARVVAVLDDRPWLRTFHAMDAGVVERVGDALLVRAGGSPTPTLADIETALSAPGHDTALGSAVGAFRDNDYCALGWALPAPHAVHVARGAEVSAGTPIATCRCTLDEWVRVFGEASVERQVQQELAPELTVEEGGFVALALLDWLEQTPFGSSSDGDATMIRRSDFELVQVGSSAVQRVVPLSECDHPRNASPAQRA